MKQLVGSKRRNECIKILGKHVIAAFMNDNIPHGFVQAWVNQKDAYLINLKRKSYVLQIFNGKLRIFRPRLFKRIGDVQLPKIEPKTEVKEQHTAGCKQRSFVEGKCTCWQDFYNCTLETAKEFFKPKDVLEKVLEETYEVNRMKEVFGVNEEVANKAYEVMT